MFIADAKVSMTLKYTPNHFEDRWPQNRMAVTKTLPGVAELVLCHSLRVGG